MTTEKRSAPRQNFDRVAKIVSVDGTFALDARILDISASGTRLMVTNSSQVPDEFLLALTGDGKVHRVATVMWRADDEIGVRFRSIDQAVAGVRKVARDRQRDEFRKQKGLAPADPAVPDRSDT
jgi:hypothetical protein